MAGPNESKGIPIPSPLIEFILLGPFDDRRQLQDSPILGDVWVEFGKRPAEALELLIAPFRGQHAGAVAAAIDEGLGPDDTKANISYLQGIIAARLTFKELLQVVVPKTKWWLQERFDPSGMPAKPKKKGRQKRSEPSAPVQKLAAYTTHEWKRLLDAILVSAKHWHMKEQPDSQLQETPALDRFAALTALILWAGAQNPPKDKNLVVSSDDQISFILSELDTEEISESLGDLFKGMLKAPVGEALVWQVSLNRRPVLALTKSIPAVKADAAKTLFKVNCSDIGWAVVDSGIDGNHPAFYTDDGNDLRIKKSFDFRDFRSIVSL